MVRNTKKVFILVLLTLVFTFAQAQPTETVAQIEVNGAVIENGTIDAEEVSSYYGYYLQYYGSLDPLFEEPYVKAFILNELIKERLYTYFANKDGITVEELQAKNSSVSEEDMQNYYNANRDNLMQDEQYVDFDYAYFETQEEAKAFYDKAAQVGFDKALEESNVLENDSYTGLKKYETAEAFIDVLFGSYDNPLRISYSDDGSFVFRVNKLNDMSTYELFKESQVYNEVLGQIVTEKFDQYINDRVKDEKVAIKTSDGYAIWIAIAKNEDMQKIFDTFYPVVFSKDGKVVTDDPWLLSGLLVSIEDAKKTDQYAIEYNALIEKLYNMGYKSFTILARMRDLNDSEQVKLEYNVALSDLLLHDIEGGNIMYVFQYLYINIGELNELTQSENPQIRQKALEYLYKMYKALGDIDSALEYLQTLQNENPQYMDFDAVLNELNQN